MIHSYLSKSYLLNLNLMQETYSFKNSGIFFKNSANSIMEQNIPTKTFRNNNSLPWFNRKLQRLIRRKARLYKQAKKTRQWSDYKAFQNFVKRNLNKQKLTILILFYRTD